MAAPDSARLLCEAFFSGFYSGAVGFWNNQPPLVQASCLSPSRAARRTMVLGSGLRCDWAAICWLVSGLAQWCERTPALLGYLDHQPAFGSFTLLESLDRVDGALARQALLDLRVDFATDLATVASSASSAPPPAPASNPASRSRQVRHQELQTGDPIRHTGCPVIGLGHGLVARPQPPWSRQHVRRHRCICTPHTRLHNCARAPLDLDLGLGLGPGLRRGLRLGLDLRLGPQTRTRPRDQPRTRPTQLAWPPTRC